MSFSKGVYLHLTLSTQLLEFCYRCALTRDGSSVVVKLHPIILQLYANSALLCHIVKGIVGLIELQAN